MNQPTHPKGHLPAGVRPAPVVAPDVEEADAVLALEAELGGTELPGNSLTPEVQAHLDRMLYKMRELRQAIADVEQAGALRVEEIQRWVMSTTRTMRHQLQYLDTVATYAAGQLEYRGKAKSVSLPSGVLGRKAQQPVLAIQDEAKALAFSKQHGIPFKQVEEPYVGQLKEYVERTGIVPDGCTYDTRPDKPYVKVSE